MVTIRLLTIALDLPVQVHVHVDLEYSRNSYDDASNTAQCCAVKRLLKDTRKVFSSPLRVALGHSKQGIDCHPANTVDQPEPCR